MIITPYVVRAAAGRVKVDDHELLRRVNDRLHTKMRLDLIRDERAS